jgi:hypothetical protein
MKVLSPVVYNLRSPSGQKILRAHIKDLKPYRMTEPPTDCANISRMPDPRAPPAPADLPSAKQQLRRRQAGRAELAQAARRAAHQLLQRFRRAPQTPQNGKRRTRNPKDVRNPPALPRTGPTASGENPLLPQTRPAASICWTDGSDRRALPRLTGVSRGPGTPMDLTDRSRQRDPTSPLPPLPLPRVPDRSHSPDDSTPPISTPTGPPEAPPTGSTGSPPEHTLQPADHLPGTTTTPTATTVAGITALPRQACLSPAAPPTQTADPQGDRPCPGGTPPRRPRRRKVKRTRTGKRVRQYVRPEGTPPAWEP